MKDKKWMKDAITGEKLRCVPVRVRFIKEEVIPILINADEDDEKALELFQNKPKNSNIFWGMDAENKWEFELVKGKNG
jgi:hypothetical protein